MLQNMSSAIVTNSALRDKVSKKKLNIDQV